jgi:hypothetical protein
MFAINNKGTTAKKHRKEYRGLIPEKILIISLKSKLKRMKTRMIMPTIGRIFLRFISPTLNYISCLSTFFIYFYIKNKPNS